MEPDEQNLALSQGLLGLGEGLLSGSFGHYGAFGPALGQGVQGFTQNFGNAMHMSLQRQQMAQQQKLQGAQIANYQSEVDKRNAELKAQQDAIANAQGADQFANGQFPRPMQGQVPQSPAPSMGPQISQQAWTQPNQQPIPPTSQADITAPTVDVSAKGVSNLMNPDWHIKRAEYLYSKGDRKGAEEAAKRASELRGEDYKLGTPITKMVPAGNDMEQMFELDRNSGKWNKLGEPRHIFTQTPLVKIGMTQETAAAAKMGTTDAETVGAYQQAAMAGQKLMPLLKRMEANVDKTFSGAGANFATDLGNVATSLGVGSPDLIRKVASSEQAVADIAELVRTKIKALGSGTAISNMDLLFTNKSMPDLLKTPTGRRMIIKAMKSDIQNVVADHQAARKWFDSHGKSLADFVPPSANAEPLDFDAPSTGGMRRYNPATGKIE